MSTWKVIFATLVIFCAGLVAGGLGTRALLRPRQFNVASPPPQNMRAEMLFRMTRELELNPGQRMRIEGIILESQERNREILDLLGPELREEFRKTVKQIREELTPEQRQRFEKLMEQRNRRPGLQPMDGRNGRGLGPLPGEPRPGNFPDRRPQGDSVPPAPEPR